MRDQTITDHDLINPFDHPLTSFTAASDSSNRTQNFAPRSQESIGLDYTSQSQLIDFSPPIPGVDSRAPHDLRAEVKVVAPPSSDGSLPGIGISSGTDMFLPDMLLPDVQFRVDKSGSDKPPSPPEQALQPDSALPANDRIAQVAEKNAGTKPWLDTKYTPQVEKGKLAGAAAVSMVLQETGYHYADSANVGKLSDQLIKQGWSMVPADQAKAGDVIYGGRPGTDWRAGGGNAHVGIVAKDGKVWHNDSATGKWQSDSVANSFPEAKYGKQVWVLRPPQTNIPDGKSPDHPVRPNRPERPDRPHHPHLHPKPDDRRPRPGDDRPDDPPRVRPEDDLRPGDRSEQEARVLDVAKHSVNKRLWARSDFANEVNGGRLGCAASVSEVLKESGFSYANSAGVGGIVDILKHHGWTKVPLSESRAGDVVYGGKPGTRWWEGGGNAHIGIVGENGQVFHNSSGRRQWVQDNLTRVFNSNRFGNERFAMRPPAKS